MASSSEGSPAVHGSGKGDENCVKCGRRTTVWKSRSDQNFGRKYNRCPTHIFSHWYVEEEVTAKQEDEATSRVQEDNNATMLLREQQNTNMLLREMISTNQELARLQREQNLMNKLCVVLLVKVVLRD